MTLAQALDLADELIENHNGSLGIAIKLLYAFKEWGGDPLGQSSMSRVLKRLYSDTDHCEDVGLANFVRQSEDNSDRDIDTGSSLPA